MLAESPVSKGYDPLPHISGKLNFLIIIIRHFHVGFSFLQTISSLQCRTALWIGSAMIRLAVFTCLVTGNVKCSLEARSTELSVIVYSGKFNKEQVL